MKIRIFLALTLAVLYVAQAEAFNKEDALGHHPLEQDHNQGNTFQELAQQGRSKRATCTTTAQCAAICATRKKDGVCRKNVCKCY